MMTKPICDQTGLDRYPSRVSAGDFLRAHGIEGYVFYCPGCQGWHVGRRTTGKSKHRRKKR
jgi:hypothetical protein